MKTRRFPANTRTLAVASLISAAFVATGTVGPAVAKTPDDGSTKEASVSARHYPQGEEFFPPEVGDTIGNGQVGVWWTQDTSDVLEEDLDDIKRNFLAVTLQTGAEWSEEDQVRTMDSFSPDTMYLVDDPRVEVGTKIYHAYTGDAWPSIRGYAMHSWTTPYELGVASQQGPFFVQVEADKPTKIGVKNVYYKVGYVDLKVNIDGIDEADFDALRDTPPDGIEIYQYFDDNMNGYGWWSPWFDCQADYDTNKLVCNSEDQIPVTDQFQVANLPFDQFSAPEGYYVKNVTYVNPNGQFTEIPGKTVGFGGTVEHKAGPHLELTVTYGKIQEVTPEAPTLVPAEGCGQQATVTIPEVEGVEYTEEVDGDTVTVTAKAAHGFVLDPDARARWTFDVAAEACPLAQFLLTFDANGGTGAPAEIEVTEGDTITIPEVQPTREGFVFTGWLPVNLQKIDTLVQPGDEYTATSSVKFIAQWEEEETVPPTEPTEPPTTEPPTTEPETELPATGGPTTGNGTGGNSNNSGNASGALAQTGSNALPGVITAALLAASGLGLLFARKRSLKKK